MSLRLGIVRLAPVSTERADGATSDILSDPLHTELQSVAESRAECESHEAVPVSQSVESAIGDPGCSCSEMLKLCVNRPSSRRSRLPAHDISPAGMT